MRRAAAIACIVAAGLGGCKTEKSGAVGDTLDAKGIAVTVAEVDTTPPVPASDVTGLSTPAPGFKLFGARVRVCSGHGGATGAFDFGLDLEGGGHGRLNYPARNYDRQFAAQRHGCGAGWIVFELPTAEQPKRITYGFEDTGSARRPQTRVDARFSWSVAG